MFFSLDNDIQYEQSQKKIRALGLGVFLVLSLGVAAFGVTRAASYSSKDGEPVRPAKAQKEVYEHPIVTKEDYARGVGELQNALIEYSDFQCPVCAPYASMVSDIEKEFRGKLTVIYRNFPKDSLHENARRAAQAAQAAGEQGKFWQMHDMLYKKQAEWSFSVQPMEVFAAYAKSLSLDIKKFRGDMASPAIEESIEKDIASGKKSSVDGVPTFFLNGKKIPSPHTVDEFKEIIAKELEHK
jgi:protein-disulfide isomerase